MSRLYVLLLLMYNGAAMAQPRIQLSPPLAVADSVFFVESATVRLELDYPGVELRYTLNGSPVSKDSPVYWEPLVLSQSAAVRAQAFHPDFGDSPEVSLSVRSLGYSQRLEVAKAIPGPATQYAGTGLTALTDREKGALNFAASPSAWLGWETDTLRLQLEAPQPVAASQLVLSLLDNAGAWILPPAAVVVYSDGQVVGSTVTEAPEPGGPTRFKFLEVPLRPWRSKTLEVVVLARYLPDWHDGAGSPAWIFLDEILLTQKP